MSYKCSIIANPEGKTWDFATRVYEELRQRSDDFELNRVTIKRFRDGECKPKIEHNVRKRNCFFIHDSNLPPTDWHLQLHLINETMYNSSSHEVVDVLPYLKFSRQDRKDESRTSQSAKALTSIIEPYADRVLTVDVHNPAIQGFYNIPFDNLYSFPTVVKYLREHHPEILEGLVIMSPDAGGATRAQALARKLRQKEIAIGYKTRPKEGEVDHIRILGDIEGRHVLMIDDIIDSGNTLVKASMAAHEQGAKEVYTYCTHALFTEGLEKVVAAFDRMFISDTVKQPSHEKVEVISLVQLFAEAIFRTNEGQSLSELFE
ncbi:ribose-phosphate diphosphokinase [Candidatus Woesearchaeota archaeon]|nr:ribose-phosphate diphosphokinase [Candidatus Woesearchaeota archaeon]